MFKKLLTLICLLALVGMVAWKLAEPGRVEKKRLSALLATSDVRAFPETVTVGGDDWIGYLIFKSRVMQDALAAQGIGLSYRQQPDFNQRVAELGTGQLDIAALTIDSFILNGQAHAYPGVIGFIIDESSGGDVIIGGPGINRLDDLRRDGIRGTFVGQSPSEFLLKATSSHFRLKNIQRDLRSWRTSTAQESYTALATKKADFAVLWEPQASQALREIPGTQRLTDTNQARDIIVDIAVFGRKFLQERPKVAQAVVKAYFQALHHYLNQPEELLGLAAAWGKVPREQARALLGGLTFASLPANHDEWFGSTSTTPGRLFETIPRITEILIEAGDLPDDPLSGNPHMITNRRLLGDLVGTTDVPVLTNPPAAPARDFSPLTLTDWNQRASQAVGTLVDDPILFQRGTTELTDESLAVLDQALAKTNHYPRYRIIIEAGVSPGNDPAEDLRLSTARAEAIRTLFIQSKGLVENRIYAFGTGSQQAPPRLTQESYKAWENRCRYARILLAAY